MPEDILYIHDGSGKLVAVQIPAAVWEKLEPAAMAKSAPARRQADISVFDEFMSAWDLRYGYKPCVECPHCHAGTADWREDAQFILVNANIGGLLVFECRNCGATIRQKYFRDHMVSEFTPPAP